MSMTICQLETDSTSTHPCIGSPSWSHTSSLVSSPESGYLEPVQLSLGRIHLPLSKLQQGSPSVACWLRDQSDSCNTSTDSRKCPRGIRKKSTRGKSVNSTVVCLSPHCNSTFKRRADLDRHYKHLHSPESVKDRFVCDYTKCPRRVDPFHRRDHFRDHLREFHKEDIEKRSSGSVAPSSSPSSWKTSPSTASSTLTTLAASQAKPKAASDELMTREAVHTFQNNQAETGCSNYKQPQHEQNAQSDLERGWWRCVKCLKRMYFQTDCLQCTHCGGRRRARA